MDPVITAVARSLLRTLTPSVDYALSVAEDARKKRKANEPARPLLEVLTGRATEAELATLFHLAPKPMGELNRYYFLAQRDLTAVDVRHCEAMVATPILAARSLINASRDQKNGNQPDRAVLDVKPWARVVDLYRNQFRPESDPSGEIETAEGILTEAANSLGEFVTARQDAVTRRHLAFGLLWTTGILLLVVFAIGAAFFAVDSQTELKLGSAGFATLRDSLACVAAGGAGAATSVLFRLRQVADTHRISNPLGSAAFRVTIGAFFALGILLLLKSHIVDILKDPSDSRGVSDITVGFFWAAAGYLAGFNERWVGNILDRDKETDEPPTSRS